MAIEIVKKDFWRRLKERFSLEDYGLGTKAFMSDSVQPVTSVDEVQKEPHVLSGSFDISGAVAWQTLWTVPAGKRWHLKMAFKGVSTGTSYMRINDGSNFMELGDATTTVLVSYFTDVRLSAGWLIETLQTNNGADVSRTRGILYEEEDLAD